MSKKKTFDEFLHQARNKYGNKFVYDENTYVNTHEKMRIICPVHGEFWQTPKSHLLYDCKKCSYEKRGEKFRSNTKEFIEKAIKIHGDKYDYSKIEYSTAKKPVIIICKKHGEFFQAPNYHLSGEGCPCCNESKLEKKVEDFLIKNKISYKKQDNIGFLGKQNVDFYLDERKIAIECQGKQHFGLGGWSACYDFELQFKNDEKKYLKCIENQIKILYIIPKNIKIPENLYFYKKDNTICENGIDFELLEKIFD